jgi:hypothetical protein
MICHECTKEEMNLVFASIICAFVAKKMNQRKSRSKKRCATLWLKGLIELQNFNGANATEVSFLFFSLAHKNLKIELFYGHTFG